MAGKDPLARHRSRYLEGLENPEGYEARRFTYALLVMVLGGIAGTVVGILGTRSDGLFVALFFSLLALAVELRGAIVGAARYFSDSVTLHLGVDRDPKMSKTFREILHCYNVLLDGALDPSFVAKAQSYLNRCASDVRNLAAGRMSTDKSRGLLYLIERLEDSQLRTMHAVSHAPIWNGQAGDNFNQLNIRRASEGVRIERVFIESESLEGLSDERRSPIIAQANAPNMFVFVVKRDEIEDKTLLQGLAVFDERVYVSLDRPGRMAEDWQVEMSSDPHEVQAALERFKALRAMAEPCPRSLAETET